MASEPLSETPDTSATEEGESNFWKCGDKFKYPMPTVDGDPWTLLLDPQLEKEKEKCEVWKDEVGNVLIFAGLFSAVVTAFIIESYKGLQPGPNDTVIMLLSRIAINLENNGNSSSTTIISPQLSPKTGSPGISRVNILWFISLVLSLTVVLVGTVSLQWLRQYLRYPADLEPEVKFAIFNMRREGFESWYVPQAFVALPILLQLSLILFLVGLIDFLLLFAPSNVYVPVISIIGLPILFLSLTTILPACFWIFPPPIYTAVLGHAPSQCPYKSPQAHVFQTILAPLVKAITPKQWRPFAWSDECALYLRQQCSLLLFQKWRDTLGYNPDNAWCDKLWMDDFNICVPRATHDLSAGLMASASDATEWYTIFGKSAWKEGLLYECLQKLLEDTACNLDNDAENTGYDMNTIKLWWYKYIQFGLEIKTNWNLPLRVGTITEQLQMDNEICVFEETVYRLMRDFGSEHLLLVWELFVRITNEYIQSPLRNQSFNPDYPYALDPPAALSAQSEEVRQDISRQYTNTLIQLFNAAAGTTTAIKLLDETGIVNIRKSYNYALNFISGAREIQTTADISLTLRHIQGAIKPTEESSDTSQNVLLFFFQAEYTGRTVIGSKSFPEFASNCIKLNSRVDTTEAMALIQSLSKWQDSLNIAPEPIIDTVYPDGWSGYIRLWYYWKHSNPNTFTPNPTLQLSLPSPPIPNAIPENASGAHSGSAASIRSIPMEINNV